MSDLIDTPHGPARVLSAGDGSAGTLVLGHGAGGSSEAPDLAALTAEAAGAGWLVHRVDQPWRVAGKRIAPAPPRLDEAWGAVLDRLRLTDRLSGRLVLGGRSAGARVACRTAVAEGAAGVLALAFPLHPPGRPDRSRAAELPTTVPTLVVNGDRDPFGVPTPTPAVQVAIRPGATHDLRKDLEGTTQTVLTWLRANHWATPAT
jgi:predicted alpha/beta-hydrolase family hydrolase